MDEQRFDHLTRAVATAATRRQAFALLGALATIGLRPRSALAMQADPTCAAGLTYCADAAACVDLQTDLNHCGGCGSVCESGLVPVACRAGECVRATCPVGQEYCGAVDLCRDLTSDPAHCGACANPCASGSCSGGVCTAPGGGCAPGQVECSGICVDTCCNNEHCGACGNVCTGGLTCFEGQCDCPSGLCCAEGEVICDGACVATCCNNNHCGACGNVCGGGLTCFEGKCDCPSGLCPPTKLPNTGTGAQTTDTTAAAWAAMAAVSAAAIAVAGRRNDRQESKTETS